MSVRVVSGVCQYLRTGNVAKAVYVVVFVFMLPPSCAVTRHARAHTQTPTNPTDHTHTPSPARQHCYWDPARTRSSPDRSHHHHLDNGALRLSSAVYNRLPACLVFKTWDSCTPITPHTHTLTRISHRRCPVCLSPSDCEWFGMSCAMIVANSRSLRTRGLQPQPPRR